MIVLGAACTRNDHNRPSERTPTTQPAPGVIATAPPHSPHPPSAPQAAAPRGRPGPRRQPCVAPNPPTTPDAPESDVRIDLPSIHGLPSRPRCPSAVMPATVSLLGRSISPTAGGYRILRPQPCRRGYSQTPPKTLLPSRDTTAEATRSAVPAHPSGQRRPLSAACSAAHPRRPCARPVPRRHRSSSRATRRR